MSPTRRALLNASAAVPALATGAAAASTTDATLVAMAAELRAIEAAYNTGCGTSDEFCRSPEGEGMMDRLEDIIGRMSELPAEGLEGIAAKAGRLCFSLHPRSGGHIMCCEDALVASLADDLSRLVPHATGGPEA